MLRRTGALTMVIVAVMHTAPAQKFTAPVLATSAGQSAEVTMVGMMCKRLKIDASVLPKASVADLKGVKTLILVPGYSSKGLGAAGISKEEEMARVEGLIAAAKKGGIPILMMHIGGVPRRGAQSDPFNTVAAEAASHLIVVKQGDEDGFFTALAGKQKIGIDLVDKMADSMKPLESAFSK